MEAPRSIAYLGSIAQVDETILKTQKFLSDLYTHRNSLSLINARLPKELLCEIFLYLAAEVRMTRTSRRPPYKWIKAINICRHWRNTALQYPRLWTQIVAGLTNECLDVMLARSKQAPLTIIGPSEHHRFPTHSDKILPHLHRVRHLHIYVPATRWRRFHTSLNSASIIETLWLSSEGSDPPLDATASLPRLRHLELHSVMPHGLVQPTLISLRVKKIPTAQPVAYWISLLQGLPSLQDLVIECGFGSRGETASHFLGRAHLPNLRNLTLVEFSKGAMSAEFLQHIDCPTSITISFEGAADIDDQTCYDHIHRAISTKTYGDAVPLLSCCMGDGANSWGPQFSFRLWSTHETMESMVYSPEQLTSQPRVTMTWSGHCLRQASHSFLQSFSLLHLRALCFDARVEPDDGTWRQCLGLTDLRELRVMHRVAVESLARALCDPDVSHRTQTLFPLLEELTISHISWSSHSPGDSNRKPARRDLLQDVHRMLLWRKGLSLPLKRLDIDVGRNLEPRRMSQFAKDAEEQELLEVFEWWARDSTSSNCSTPREDQSDDGADSEDVDDGN